jgi:hypothetical protein
MVLLASVIAPGTAFAKRKKGKRGGAHHVAKRGTLVVGAKRVAVLVDAGAVSGPLVGTISKVLRSHQITPGAGAAVWKAVGKDLPTTDDGWAQAAARLRADAIVEAILLRTGNKHRLAVVVHNGADGSAAGRAIFAGQGSPKSMVASVGAQFWKKLGPAIAGAKKGEGSALPPRDLSAADPDTGNGPRSRGAEPANASEPEGESKVAAEVEERPRKKARRDDAEERPRKKARRDEEDAEERSFEDGAEADEEAGDDASEEEESTFTSGALRTAEVELDLRALRRTYQYSPANAARPYELKVALLVGGQAFWYPTKYAGVFARGEWTASLKSGPYPTVTRELILGAQGRYPLAAGEIHLNAAYFQHLFSLQDSPDPNDAARSTLTTPNVTYQGLRLGGGGRFYLNDRMLAGAEGGYRLVTDPGSGTNQIHSAGYFPNAKPFVAFDLAGFFGYKIMDFLEARVSIDFRRYVFGMQTGPTLTVAGIADDFMALNLGLVGVLGGK